MKQQEILENIGKIVSVNGTGDLLFDSNMKKLIMNNVPVKIIKVTRSGLVYIEAKGNYYTIPAKNLSFLKEYKC